MTAHRQNHKAARTEAASERLSRGSESAHYAADLILELRNLAQRSGQTFLTYLLEMAFYEAFTIANGVPMGESELERLRLISRQAREAPLPPPEYRQAG